MTNNKDFQAELAEKIKAGVKPSDLKKSKSTPPSRSSFDNEKYVAELETEKAELLKQIANYEKEQKARIVVFKDQKKLLTEKDKQLISKDEQLTEKEEQITKLKTRIHELAEKVKALKKFQKSHNDKETAELGTQTTGKSPSELEEEILEKRVDNIKDFGNYRQLLQEKDNKIAELTSLITEFNKQIDFYQKKVKALFSPSPNDKKNVIIIIFLTIAFITTAFFK